MKLKLQFIFALFIALTIYIPTAHGQAHLTFSGGSGAPLQTTLLNPVTYTITNTSCAAGGPVFLFDETGNALLGSFLPVTGTITYSINNGAAQPISSEASGVAASDITANDIFIFGNQTGATNGSIVVLNAGTITTNSNVSGARPANGSYATFITDGNGVRCSTNGISVAPTAGEVTISGRAISANGRGIRDVVITLTDSAGARRTARTTAFGRYRFTDVNAGETYVITAKGKRFIFTQPSQVLNANENNSSVDFVANP